MLLPEGSRPLQSAESKREQHCEKGGQSALSSRVAHVRIKGEESLSPALCSPPCSLSLVLPSSPCLPLRLGFAEEVSVKRLNVVHAFERVGRGALR